MRSISVAIGIAALAAIASAGAQTYPSRPVSVIVTYPPGGPVDTVTETGRDRRLCAGAGDRRQGRDPNRNGNASHVFAPTVMPAALIIGHHFSFSGLLQRGERGWRLLVARRNLHALIGDGLCPRGWIRHGSLAAAAVSFVDRRLPQACF